MTMRTEIPEICSEAGPKPRKATFSAACLHRRFRSNSDVSFITTSQLGCRVSVASGGCVSSVD
jgi:hypothetical protein